MIISYYDEAGDDGFPRYSSPLFVLSCIYFHYQSWQDNYKNIAEFRKYLAKTVNFPYTDELHTRDFLLNKGKYYRLGLSANERMEIVEAFLCFLPTLDIRIINVAINKTTITKTSYDVLDTAFKYSIQRIENDLNQLDPTSRFMIITDPGRVGKMRKTSRKIQKFNYIPSKFNPSSYRQEIKRLIEDPLPKESNQSFFIQLADLVTFVVYHYERNKLKIGSFPARMLPGLDDSRITKWMDLIKPKLNLKASSNDPYGVVCYPR